MCVHYDSCFYIICISFIRVTIFILCIFGSVVIQTTYTRTYPISFVSAKSPLYFCSESMIKYIHFRIRIWSLSAPLWIRWKNMVEDIVNAKSDPIRSIYIPTSISATNTDKSGGGKICNATIIGPRVACLHNPHHHPSVGLALGPLPSCNDGVTSRAMLLACSKQGGNLPRYQSVVNGGVVIYHVTHARSQMVERVRLATPSFVWRITSRP
jgi:hypothetical protein